MLIVGVSVISLAVARAPVVRFAPIVHPESHLAQALIALVTLTLLFNVFFNYYHAIVGQPGSVAHLPKPINPRPFEENETETTTTGATSHDGVAEDSEDTAPEVTRGTFAGCRLCVPCGGAKPRGAHHCRTCRTCVRGMDHHCPFIANCVGADNPRHFMLFCLYVAVGCGWSLAWAVACAKADADGYRTFMDALFDSSAYGQRAVDVAGERGGSLEDLAKVSGVYAFCRALFAWTYAVFKAGKLNINDAFDQSPQWLNAWAFVCCIGGLICVATTGLFVSTVNSVASGETYIETLKSRSVGARGGMASDADEGELRDGSGGADGGEGRDGSCVRGCTKLFRCLSGYCPFVTEFCGCFFWFCVPSEFGPAPWSKIGMFHLRQVFGSGHPITWAMPTAKPPQGTRGASQLKKE